MKIFIIAAMDRNGLIGKGDSLPWKISEDLKRFKKLTTGKTLIMGSRTYDGLPSLLPGRKILVLDKKKRENCLSACSIKEALDILKNEKEVFIAGGASVYKQFIPLADRMYLTKIDEEFEGDVYFPNYNKQNWVEVNRELCQSCSFIVLERVYKNNI